MSSAWAASAEPLPRFPPGAVWNQSIADASLHPDSDVMIDTLVGLGGFGFGRFQIDFSLQVVHALENSPTRTTVSHPGGYYAPDCDALGGQFPVPADAAIEGQSDLDCNNSSSDCHLLVVQGNRLYEAYQARGIAGEQLEARCVVSWNLDAVYPPEGRGEHCTSADAAGFPIAPLLFNADEIAQSLASLPDGSGDIGHAVRFILPNARMASDDSLGGVAGRLYVRPASHAGAPSGPVDAVPYGSRLRLRADFPMAGYSPAARVILNTLKRYGMLLADGGNIALTAESDRYTETAWSELGINSREFDLTSGAADVTAADFEVLDTGLRIAETYDCVRAPTPTDEILYAGFEL